METLGRRVSLPARPPLPLAACSLKRSPVWITMLRKIIKSLGVCACLWVPTKVHRVSLFPVTVDSKMAPYSL